MLLNDNSGKAVFELRCDIKTDPANPLTADIHSWPTCVKNPRCTDIPVPDDNATVSSGMENSTLNKRWANLSHNLNVPFATFMI